MALFFSLNDPPKMVHRSAFALNVEKYLDSYSEQQKKNWENSKKIVVYESEDQLRAFVEDAKERKNAGKKLYLGKIKSNVAKQVKKATSYDIEGYNCALYSDNIRKVFKDHGDEETENLRGQREVETEDFTRIPEVISEPDVIENAGMYNKHPVVHFKKDGITIVGVIADGALDLYTQTMYISKKNRSLATAIDEQTSINTSETTRSTASNNIISDDTKNTTPKRKSSLSSGNEDALPIRGDVYGKDISLDIPIRDDIAPVQA